MVIMSTPENRRWMYKRKDHNGFLSRSYCKSVECFLDIVYSNEAILGVSTNSIRCPCRKCNNVRFKPRDVVKLHLLKHGFTPNYTTWYCHGETYKLNHEEPCFNHLENGYAPKYNGGSVSIAEHRHRMESNLKRPVTEAEAYEETHTCKKPRQTSLVARSSNNVLLVAREARSSNNDYITCKVEKVVVTSPTTPLADTQENLEIRNLKIRLERQEKQHVEMVASLRKEREESEARLRKQMNERFQKFLEGNRGGNTPPDL